MCDEPYMVIGLGNAYDFVIKNVNEPETYGTFQGDRKSIKEFIGKVNSIVKENDELKQLNKMLQNNIERLSDDINYLKTLPSEHRELWKQSEVKRVTLQEENEKLKRILEDCELLMSDEEVINVRTEMADKFIKPLCKENGFDVDVDCTDGFTIIPKRLVKCSECRYDRGYYSDAWCEKNNKQHSIDSLVECSDFKEHD